MKSTLNVKSITWSLAGLATGPQLGSPSGARQILSMGSTLAPFRPSMEQSWAPLWFRINGL